MCGRIELCSQFEEVELGAVSCASLVCLLRVVYFSETMSEERQLETDSEPRNSPKVRSTARMVRCNAWGSVCIPPYARRSNEQDSESPEREPAVSTAAVNNPASEPAATSTSATNEIDHARDRSPSERKHASSSRTSPKTKRARSEYNDTHHDRLARAPYAFRRRPYEHVPSPSTKRRESAKNCVRSQAPSASESDQLQPTSRPSTSTTHERRKPEQRKELRFPMFRKKVDTGEKDVENKPPVHQKCKRRGKKTTANQSSPEERSTDGAGTSHSEPTQTTDTQGAKAQPQSRKDPDQSSPENPDLNKYEDEGAGRNMPTIVLVSDSDGD